MDEAKKLVIDVVAWNSRAYLPGLLSSLDEQTTRDFTVTIVDNASDDGTIAWLQSSRPDVAALRNFRNQGFARAHNQAIALALSRWDESGLNQRYVMIANPDLEFAPAAIETLIHFMDTHPDIAACGPKLLRAFTTGADEERRDVERSNMIDSTGILIKRSRQAVDRGAGEEDQGQYDAQTDVFGISGACLLTRASALMASKLAGEFLDEDFFAYKEDVDLCWRMRRLGMKLAFVPEAVVWHHRRAASAPHAGWLSAWKKRYAKSPTVNFLSTRNQSWVIMKNDFGFNFFLHAIWWLPYEFAKVVASLVSWPSLKGECASVAGWPRMMAKRKELAARTNVTAAEMRRWFV